MLGQEQMYSFERKRSHWPPQAYSSKVLVELPKPYEAMCFNLPTSFIGFIRRTWKPYGNIGRKFLQLEWLIAVILE
jgi:hypothetical protein